MKKPTEAEWGWLAGLIDGDGCISIGNAAGRYRASVIIVNKKPQNILKLIRLFGGSVGGVKRDTSNSFVNGSYYRWVISSLSDVSWLLTNAAPHMAEKRSKADIAIALCALQLGKRNLHSYKLSGAFSERLELLYRSALVETTAISEDDVAAINKERPGMHPLQATLKT